MISALSRRGGVLRAWNISLLKEPLNEATSAPQGASQSLMRPESRESEGSLFRASLKTIQCADRKKIGLLQAGQ